MTLAVTVPPAARDRGRERHPLPFGNRRHVMLELTDTERAHLATWMLGTIKTTPDETELGLARKLMRLTDPETDPDAEIRQMSIELAARQRDLITIHEMTDDIATWAEQRGWQPDDAWVAKVAELADIADPDGWADGTAELAWEAAAEAPVGGAPPAPWREQQPGVTAPAALADIPDMWTMVITFETGVRAERQVRALYLIGDAIMDTRNQLSAEGAITRIELT